jgi:hypothetical protein
MSPEVPTTEDSKVLGINTKNGPILTSKDETLHKNHVNIQGQNSNSDAV